MYQIKTPPESTVITTAEAAAYLRVNLDDWPSGSETHILGEMLYAAEDLILRETGFCGHVRRVVAYFSGISDWKTLPVGPVERLQEQHYMNEAGSWVSISTSDFMFLADGLFEDTLAAPIFWFDEDFSPELHQTNPYPIRFEYDAGFSEMTLVPMLYKEVVMLVVSRWYNFRDGSEWKYRESDVLEFMQRLKIQR